MLNFKSRALYLTLADSKYLYLFQYTDNHFAVQCWGSGAKVQHQRESIGLGV